MRRLILTPLTLAVVLLTGLALHFAPGIGAANLQAASQGDILFQATLPEGGLTAAPAFVRLLRITLDPGASSPLHTHPGPEIARVESGTLSVTVKGEALLLRSTTDESTPVAVQDAPVDEEFKMRKGDMLTYLPQTGMTFRNATEKQVKILSGVILPAGHQHPPGITYLGGQPGENAFQGVTPEILGDGVATVLPTGQSEITVDRLTLRAGEPIPAFDGNVLLSVEKGTLDFTVESGRVQVSRTATPGPQPDAAVGTTFSLLKGDAVFFPAGMKETPRSDQDGTLQLLRLTISGEVTGATPEAGAGDVGVIQLTAAGTPVATTEATTEPTTEATVAATVEARPTEEATAKPTKEPKPTKTPKPTETPAAGTYKEGDHVLVTEDGVRLRSAASTDSEIVTGLDTDQELIILGPSEQGNDLTWWPVSLAADESITGYVAEDFIKPIG